MDRTRINLAEIGRLVVAALALGGLAWGFAWGTGS